MENNNGKFITLLYEGTSVLITAALIIAVLFTFFIRFVGVVGSSMNPILSSGDWVVLNQVGINYKPHYGDIVVIEQPGELNENIIKRVIATEGDTININFTTGAVYLNGAEIEESYINNLTINSYDVDFPLTVPEGYCFVMGDNRQNSIDSRSTLVGLIDNRSIIGEGTIALTDNGFISLNLKDYQ